MSEKTYEIRFKDRQPTFPGRKKLTIVNQQGNVLIVDEVFADEPSEEGTKINANLMNELDRRTFYAEDAKSVADEAKVIAQEAKEFVITSSKGTVIYVNNKAVETFDMDTKANASDLNSAETRVANLEQKLSKVKYDSNLAIDAPVKINSDLNITGNIYIN